MKIKSIIIDDEAIARDVLNIYLTKYCPQIEILGFAENIKQATLLIEQIQPQLIFLDVEMPFGNAFDLLENTKNHQFETIFITAFSQYSLKALNMSAAYYILKPIDISELILAVNKVSEVIHKNENFNRNQVIIDNLKQKPEKQQIILPTLNGFDVVKIEEITRIQGNGNFTDVFLIDGNKKMVCRFLKHFDDLLTSPFLRVHRSHIVNTDFIKSYSKGSGGIITMIDGYEVEVSASYKENLLKVF